MTRWAPGLFALWLAACLRVPVGTPATDRAPVIGATFIGPDGAALPISDDGLVLVTARKRLTVTIGADNPGGVRSLEVTAGPAGESPAMFEAHDTPDANGHVAAHLAVFLPGQVRVCSTPWTIEVTSFNYNGASSVARYTLLPAP